MFKAKKYYMCATDWEDEAGAYAVHLYDTLKELKAAHSEECGAVELHITPKYIEKKKAQVTKKK